MSARHLLARAATASTSYLSRPLSTSAARHAVTNFTMPAMSPTMTSGGVATWKVKEGQAFAAGDVLLEIETDKATMDVEAQDDGVLGKIIVGDGTKDVDVGKVIALLAEEGDDISNLEAPKEEEAPPKQQEAKSSPKNDENRAGPSTPAPSTSAPASASAQSHVSFKGPIFPSVQRLIAENHIEDAENKIKGTGIRGMITKGDVLAFLGKAKTPTGSFKEPKAGIAVLGPAAKGAGGNVARPSEPLTGAELRSLIIGGLADRTKAPKQAVKEVPEVVVQSVAPVFTTRKQGIKSNDILWDLI